MRSLTSNTSKIEGHVRASGWGLGQMTSKLIIHKNLHNPNKLVNAWMEHFWCTNEPRICMVSQDLPLPELGNNILYD
jgi:hypothetical protein